MEINFPDFIKESNILAYCHTKKDHESEALFLTYLEYMFGELPDNYKCFAAGVFACYHYMEDRK